MEVFDPNIGVWKPLPNPPVPIPHHDRLVTALLLKPKKQIIFSSFLSDCDRPPECRFLAYNIDDQSWEALDTPVSVCKLLGGSNTNTPLADGDTLYWVSFDPLYKGVLVIQAYNLLTDEWFEGNLDACYEIFGKKESLIDHRPHGLIRLGHSKFCILLQSLFTPKLPKRRLDPRVMFGFVYLYCVVIVVSKVSNEEPDGRGFKELNISVVSTHKYPMDHNIRTLDAHLLDHCSITSKQKKPKYSYYHNKSTGLSTWNEPPELMAPIGSKPRVPPVTNHVSGLQQNNISAPSQFQPTSQMPATVVPGQPWYSYKRQSAASATPALQAGQQPSVIPSKDSAVNVLSLYQHSSSDWQEHTCGEERFYFNHRTKQSSWKKPLELMTPIDLVCEEAHKAVSQGTQSGTSMTTHAPDVTVLLAQTSVATISVSSTTTSTFAGVALRPVQVYNPSPVVSGSSAVSSPQSAVPAIAVGNQPPVLAASSPVSAVSGSIGVPATSINANLASMSHFENVISECSQGSVDGASVQDIEAKNEKERGEKEKWKDKGRKENEREREKGKERSKEETDRKTVDMIDSHSYKEDKNREKDTSENFSSQFPNPNPLPPIMAEESSSTTTSRILRPNDDRSVIVFGGYNWA